MTSQANKLVVKSHVSRDFLQSAALFKNDHLAVWEYVSNGLQYVTPGTSPLVKVKLDNKAKRILIQDNGIGMSIKGLQNFFVMHGENVDRKSGRSGRGMFGTGKSAAFGIAESLTVTTVFEGKRTKVRLTRHDVESMKSDASIPVAILEESVTTKEDSGTLIEIDGVHLRKLNPKRVIQFIERHLANWPADATVFVNRHECQSNPPTAIRSLSIEPSVEVRKVLGKCTLELKVAGSSLTEDERGVAIFSKGVWHETTLAGSEGREMANYIFGSVDVPALDEDTSPVRPFDMSRSMQLNAENETVRATLAFIGLHVEQLRKELVSDEKSRRASEDAKRLAKQGDEIAKILNQDFSEFRQRVAKARAHSVGGKDAGQSGHSGGKDSLDDDFIFGGDEPGVVVASEGGAGSDGTGQGNSEENSPRTLNPIVEPGEKDAPKIGKTVGGSSKRPQPRGGFSIDFRHMGFEADRAKYQREGRQIVLNLDHPQFKAALGSGTIEDLTFRRLAYEVAFSEYALALALELAQRDEYMDVTDPIVDIGETINRVARQAASLYEA